MFRFIRNSVGWMSIPFITMLLLSIAFNLFTNIDNLFFESLIIIVAWFLFTILAVIVGMLNAWCYKSVENMPRSKKALQNSVTKSGIVSFALFGIFALMTTPIVPVFPIEFNWGLLLILVFCWGNLLIGYYSILNKLLK